MATDPMFGWDLTFKTVEKDIKRKSDVLVAFIHWNLTKRGFRSIGIGDERTLSGDEEKSELLSTGWNDKDNYTLRYVLESKLYILHGLNTDGNLIVNLMKSDDLAVSNIAVKIDETVKGLSGPIDQVIPSFKDLMYSVKRDLIDSITEKLTVTSETQTMRSDSNNRRPADDPLRIPPRPLPGVHPDTPDLWELPPAHLPNIGRSDLDPFAPAGGGMLFNPFGPRRDVENPGLGIPGGLPRGAVPPGARFDPFGPPGGPMPGRRNPPPPDADHLPPPGFNDNMFMGAVPPGARFDPFGPPGGPMPGRRNPPPPDADHLPPPGFNDNMFMGAVPPGARFDPFGPPGGPMPGRRNPPPPDADHLPPPGFNDNMFM